MDACLFEFATDDFIAIDMRVVDVVLPVKSSTAPNKDAMAYSIAVVA